MHASRKNHLSSTYGPWSVVTGASEGIGTSFAHELAASGLNVVLVARREARLDALAIELERCYGVLCAVIVADLSETEGMDRVLVHTENLDIGLVVCNAGFGTSGDFLDADLAVELNMLGVNCTALTCLTHGFGRRLRERGQGGMVLLSSIVATQGVARSAHYAATKAYVQTLGEGLQREWQNTGVHLLLVAPGPVQTGFAQRAGLRMAQASTPEVVARESLRALGRRQLIHLGRLAKLMAWSLATVPRWLRVRIMSGVMAGMTRQRG